MLINFSTRSDRCEFGARLTYPAPTDQVGMKTLPVIGELSKPEVSSG